jgi:hypothetical protein
MWWNNPMPFLRKLASAVLVIPMAILILLMLLIPDRLALAIADAISRRRWARANPTTTNE